MSDFSRFMKQNKTVKPNERRAVTESLTDENGAPLLWEFRHITSKENARIQDELISRGNESSAVYIHRLIAASVVYPDLYDSALQDSYGVSTPEALLYALVDDPGEYAELALFIQKFQGFIPLSEQRDNAKNL